MYMTSSGLESFYYYKTSSGSLALPTGVPCVVCLSGYDFTVSLQGACYVMCPATSMGSVGGYKATSLSPPHNSTFYFPIVRMS